MSNDVGTTVMGGCLVLCLWLGVWAGLIACAAWIVKSVMGW
jgi:hypothetical protein